MKIREEVEEEEAEVEIETEAVAPKVVVVAVITIQDLDQNLTENQKEEIIIVQVKNKNLETLLDPDLNRKTEKIMAKIKKVKKKNRLPLQEAVHNNRVDIIKYDSSNIL